MDGFNSHNTGGSLQISSDVVEKIAKHAALEVEGVRSVMPAATVSQSLFGKLASPKPIYVELKNDVADITVSLQVAYGTKIPELSEQVQLSVKEAVQNMTSISVAKVDIIVAGMAPEAAKPAPEEKEAL